MLRTILALAIFVATLLVIMIRPYRLPEAVTASAGALLMLLCRLISPEDVVSVIAGQWNVFGFFLGLMVISAVADQAGVFDVLAGNLARWAGGSARRLYLAVFLTGVLITAFLSNDATALLLTPVVYALVTRLRLPALPFMFACTFIADSASFLLPVSNPINVLVTDSFGGGLGPFLHYLFLPSVLCILCNIGLFAWIFRRSLSLSYRYTSPILEAPATPATSSRFFRVTLVGLCVIALSYVLASLWRIPLSVVALGGCGVLLGGARWNGGLDWKRLGREVSWPLFAFVAGMFLLVRGVENVGVTTQVGHWLLAIAGPYPLPGLLLTAFGVTVGANLINNVPMALVMVSALHGVGVTSTSHPSLIYATILGADLGPNVTTVGSLATMLWLLILRRKGLDISTLEYLKLGLTVVPVMLVLSALLIWVGV